jgi:uncharacterized protein DUF4314
MDYSHSCWYFNDSSNWTGCYITKEMNFYNKVGEHPLIGKRIRLSFSSDTELNEGELGTVTDINESEFTQIGVKWDNGSKLVLIQDVDIFEILD